MGNCPYVREAENDDRLRKLDERPLGETRGPAGKSEWRPRNNTLTREMVNRRETSGGRRKRAHASVYIKVPPPHVDSLRKGPTLA
jgi:hypothetical protein